MAIVNMFPSVSQINMRELHRATNTTVAIIAWYRDHGLLAKRYNYHACGVAMIESTDVCRNDGVHWRCRDRNYRRDASTRDGSFFGNGSKLELEKVVDLLYSHLYETALFKNLI